MRYNERLKTTEIRKLNSLRVDPFFLINNVRCQYNPDRFKYWEQLFDVNKSKKLMFNINHSPHFTFLYWNDRQNKSIETTRYYNLQKMYGRHDIWILNKILKFQSMYSSIKEHGIETNPIVLNQPIAKNWYNDKMEIYEGHHRLAIAVYLNIECFIDIYEVVNNE